MANYYDLVKWCKNQYGKTSEKSTPSVTVDLSLKDQKGYYDFDRNIIRLKPALGTRESVKTILHEYQHYLRHSVEEFEENYNLGCDYDNHLFEREAEEIAQRDWALCLAQTSWRK